MYNMVEIPWKYPEDILNLRFDGIIARLERNPVVPLRVSILDCCESYTMQCTDLLGHWGSQEWRSGATPTTGYKEDACDESGAHVLEK